MVGLYCIKYISCRMLFSLDLIYFLEKKQKNKQESLRMINGINVKAWIRWHVVFI